MTLQSALVRFGQSTGITIRSIDNEEVNYLLEIPLDLSKILCRVKIFQFSEPELDKLYCQS